MFKARVATIFTILFSFGFALSLFIASPADAAIITPGFQEEVVANGFILPTAMAFANDGTIFVAEKSGTVKRIVNGVRMLTPVITLTDVNTFGDRGLIGIAADPNFGVNGYLYLSYTYENTPGAFVSGSKTARVVRVTVINGIAEESTKLVLVGTIGGNATQPSCENYLVTADCVPSDSPSHSAGGLRFGPDGKLYASFGDGADFSAVDPRALRAQNIDSLGGKVIRINPNGTAPTDNPFYNGDPNANRSKVFALGVRNSFRFNFNQTNGKLYAGDVGWSSFEEVNAIESGKNYGWPCREGLGATTYNCTPSSTATNPVYTYPHNASGSGSISVGAFPNNGAYPSTYTNTLFIGDYAQNWIKMVNLSSTGSFLSVEDFTTGMLFPVDVTAGPDGNVYYLDIGYASVNRITHTSGNRRPVVSLGATPTSGALPLMVNFSSAGTYDPDGDALTYLWNFGDGSTSTAQNPSHIYSIGDTYTAALTVTDSKGAVATKSIVITAGNRAPQAQILSPASGALYSPLELITLSATATDFEDGALPPSAYSWQVLLHHNTHVHYVQSFVGVQNPTFIADNHNDPDVYMEIILTVTDSVGLTNVKSISMYMNNGLGGANLFANPSVEIPSDGALSYLPIGWANGWFGTIDPVFSYPTGAGFDGDRAVSVRINSYTSGSAKWFPSPVYVTPGKTYTFSNLYTATVPTQVVAQYGRSDGTYQYQLLGTVPVATLPTPTTYAITIPAGAETMTVFHEIDAVGTLTTDNYVLSLAGGDTTFPSGSIVSPASSTVASGTIQVSVTASDNIGVASVMLFVDGVPVGTPDTTAPYILPWNTASSTNGVHTLTARVLDTSSNAFITGGVTLTVSNATATLINLFDNGNFEIASGTNPRSWQPGGSGTHTAVYSYPVPGITGNGIAITVTKYGPGDTGDARWVHAPIPVTSGIRYTYRTAYKATTISDVLGRYRFANGTEHYFGLIKEIPGTSNWTYVENSFVPPVGAVDVTFGHALSAEGATLTMDDVSLTITGTGTPSEINDPVVEFLSPLQGATLSGVVTLTASSSDDTAVVGVFFAINGSPLGIEDTTSPYQAVWDTRTYPNGSYLLKATTRDPYGNNTKATITVTVNNTITPPATTTNLVPNGTLEIVGTGGNPASWNRGGWGTNTRTFTYPATGFSGNGAQVTVSGYTSGDAKWYFNPVTVTPGTPYAISDRYNGTIGTEILAQFTKIDGTFQYQYLGATPATASAWQTFNATITPPTGVNALTLFHVIAGNGTLTIDNVSVTGPGSTSTSDTTLPTVSVTSPVSGATVNGTTTVNVTATDNIAVTSVSLLVDGNMTGSPDTTAPYSFTWNTAIFANGAHTVGARASDAAGNLGTSSLATVTVTNTVTPPATSTNLVSNGTFETAGASGNPAGWTRGGWGTNNRVLTYPATGQTGNGAGITITSYTNGDAKWYFDDIAVTPGTPYTFGYTYLSTVPTNISIRYTMSNGTKTWVGIVNPSASAVWTAQSLVFVPPTGAVSATVVPILNRIGSLTIDNVTVTGPGSTSTPPDTTAPTVTITSPVEGTVSGIASIAATASDDTGVVGVQFKLDGINLDAEDATAPYSISWNTASTSNGTHTLTAIARDAVGNSNTATRTVTVNNSTSTLSTFTEGMATLSFDDGWLSQYITALPILDSANIPATFNIVTNETNGAGAGELISNGSFEVAGINGDPTGWSRGGWGTNTSSYTYSNQGYTDNTAATVAITAYTSGDAKWYYEDVPVTPSQDYRYTSAYRSNIQSELVVRYTAGNGAVTYSFVATVPNSNNIWSILSHTLTPPAGAVSATMFHVISSIGTLTIDTVSFGIKNDFVTPLHIRTLEQGGNEISSHTKTHSDLSILSSTQQEIEINGSKNDLLTMGVLSVQTLAYPYGGYSSTTQLITKQSGYSGARSVERGFNTPSTNAFGLKVQGVLRTTTLAEVINWIDTAKQDKTWLILMFHQLDTDTANTFGTTPALFGEIVSYLSTSGIRTVTTAEGIQELQ